MSRDVFFIVWGILFLIGGVGTCMELDESVGNGLGWGFATGADVVAGTIGLLSMACTTFIITGIIYGVVRLIRAGSRR